MGLLIICEVNLPVVLNLVSSFPPQCTFEVIIRVLGKLKKGAKKTITPFIQRILLIIPLIATVGVRTVFSGSSQYWIFIALPQAEYQGHQEFQT